MLPTPIGNIDDLTLRALEVLGKIEIIIVETPKVARRFLSELSLLQGKNILSLTVKSKRNDVEEILEILKTQDAVLISDAGMPVIADPGSQIMRSVLDNEIEVVPLPGPSSITASLVVSGFPIYKFTYRGFLPREREERREELKKLEKEDFTTVFLETPHRLRALMQDISDVMPMRRICLCYELTTNDEEVIRGTAEEVKKIVEEKGWKKGEFSVIIEGYKSIEKNRKQKPHETILYPPRY